MRSERLIVPAGAVRLRPLVRGDYQQWRRLRLLDEHALRRVEPTVHGSWEELHSAGEFRRLRRQWKLMERDRTAVVTAIDVDGQCRGMVTLGSIRPYPVASCWVGYWVGSPYYGAGIATAAVALACDAAAKLGVHRVEATVREDNFASLEVLRRCGFQLEGVVREAFHMDGAWRDHQLLSTIAPAAVVGRVTQAGYAEPEAWHGD